MKVKPRLRALMMVGLVFLVGCVSSLSSTPTATPLPPTATPLPTIELTSTAFESGKLIPPKYTCDGEDVSPPLSWGDPPPGTQSFALLVENPAATSADGTIWAHWVLFNLPAEARGLPEAIPPEAELPDGSRHGQNSEEWSRYVGPCPPFTQRYFFRLYALDTVVALESGASAEEVRQAMEGHILAQGELMGKYKRR